MDEHRLVRSAMQGDLEAFEALVRAYQRPLTAAAWQLTRQAQDAEDLAQETLLEAFKRLSSLKDPAKFRPWLFVMLRNKCLNFLKRPTPEQVPIDAYDEVLAAPVASDARQVIDLMTQLSELDREILAARYLAELSYAEIAEALGISEIAARVRCTRARERLKAQIHQAEEQEMRELFQRATGAVLALGTGDAFVGRIMEEAHMMANAQAMTAGTAVTLKAGGVIGGTMAAWKVIAGVAAVLTVAGIGVSVARNPQFRQPGGVMQNLAAVATAAGQNIADKLTPEGRKILNAK